MVLTDFVKAFDYDDHRIDVQKLRAMNVCPCVAQLINDSHKLFLYTAQTPVMTDQCALQLIS